MFHAGRCGSWKLHYYNSKKQLQSADANKCFTLTLGLGETGDSLQILRQKKWENGDSHNVYQSTKTPKH